MSHSQPLAPTSLSFPDHVLYDPRALKSSHSVPALSVAPPPPQPPQNNKRPSTSPTPSSSKRSRLTPPTPSTPPDTPASLPLPLLLLTTAHALHSAAIALHPYIARNPALGKDAAYAQHWAEYQRLDHAALVALQQVVESEEAGGVGGGRLELRARIMMVEILISSGESSEAGRVINKGIAAAGKHPNLSPYLPPLFALQASLPPVCSSTTPSSHLKFAKSTLKRALASTSPTAFPEWIYQFHLQLSSLCAQAGDFSGALVALRDVERVASARGDQSVVWAMRVLVARMTLGEGKSTVAREAVGEVAAWMGLEMVEPPAEDKSEGKEKEKDTRELNEVLEVPLRLLGRQLVIEFVLVYCLFQVREGHCKLAKDKLKVAHQLLDEKELEEGELEGWTRIKIIPAEVASSRSPTASPAPSSSHPHSASPPAPLCITIALTPRSLIYNFAFLVSVAVHRDAFGSKPRSLLFAKEGIRSLDAKLAGTEGLPPLAPQAVTPHRVSLAQLKIHLSLFSAEIDIMRSAFSDARLHLNAALAASRTHGLWSPSPSSTSSQRSHGDFFQRRIILDEGLLAQATSNFPLAEQCFLTLLSLDPTPSPPDDLTPLALVSLLTLRLSLGHSPESLALLAAEIVVLTTAPDANPAMRLVGEVTQALTKGEIIKAKQHFSAALGVANACLQNHAKAVVLALLANLFLFTRNDQAQKMLSASFHLARGMGARQDVRTQEEKKQGVVGDEVVGNASLGLWVGERLLESYKRTDPGKVRQQEEVLVAHRHVLAEEASR